MMVAARVEQRAIHLGANGRAIVGAPWSRSDQRGGEGEETNKSAKLNGNDGRHDKRDGKPVTPRAPTKKPVALP
jgi:hypothetical protein